MPKISAVQREANRQRILDAALRCFARDGFHNTTIGDIVRASGVSQGAVYLYFATKEDIILALGDDRRSSEAAITALASAGQDPVMGLLHLIAFHGATLAPGGDLDLHRIRVQAWAEALRSPEILDGVRTGIGAVRAAIVDLVRRAQRTGQIRSEIDPEAVARVMIAAFQGAVLQVAWDDAPDLPAFGAVIDTLVRSLLTPEAAAQLPAHTLEELVP